MATHNSIVNFVWDKNREKAAELLAEDFYTDGEVAAKCKVTRKTIWNWKTSPVFRNRIMEIIREYGASLQAKYPIEKRQRRIEALQQRWEAMMEVIAKRARDPDHIKAPGGSTGLLVRTHKGLGGGDNFQVVEEFAVDTGLLKELRELEEQAARECGQRVQQVETSEKKDDNGLTDGERLALITELMRRARLAERGNSGKRARIPKEALPERPGPDPPRLAAPIVEPAARTADGGVP